MGLFTGTTIGAQVFEEAEGGAKLLLQIIHHSSVLTVEIPWRENALERIEELMFRQVSFNAVAGIQFNMNRQIVGRLFYVNSVDDLNFIEDRSWPNPEPLKAIHELARSGDNLNESVRTRGVVTYVSGDNLILRCDYACLAVRFRNEKDVQIGDFIEVVGYVFPDKIDPSFLAREIIFLEKKNRQKL